MAREWWREEGHHPFSLWRFLFCLFCLGVAGLNLGTFLANGYLLSLAATLLAFSGFVFVIMDYRARNVHRPYHAYRPGVSNHERLAEMDFGEMFTEYIHAPESSPMYVTGSYTNLTDDRARDILVKFLDDDQQQQLYAFGRFDIHVHGPVAEIDHNIAEVMPDHRIYRINQGIFYNVTIKDESGTTLFSVCHYPEGVPNFDMMLAQKLLIESDESAFLKGGNIQFVKNDYMQPFCTRPLPLGI